MTILDTLEKSLAKDKRFMSDGKLLKNKIVECALKLDPDLLRLLLEQKDLKAAFFVTVDKTEVFDKERFIKFVDNKEFLPDSYTSFKNKIGLFVNEEYLAKSNEVVLAWPYKDCVLEGGMEKEDEKRNEVFYNEILAPDEIDRLLAPKVLTNFKRFDKKGEHKVTDISSSDNLIIRGNNLLALHSLKERYGNKVKLIYIDPPYNTGTDSFNYNDSFNRSTWLTFMKNRLEIAKELLSKEGVIFVQCDDNEQAYLKVLMDEIFNPSCFVNCITVKMSEATGVKMSHSKLRFPKLKEYLLFYKNPGFEGFEEIDLYKNFEWDRENNLFLEGFTQDHRSELNKLEEKEVNTPEDVSKAVEILKNAKVVSLSKKIKELNISDCDKIEEWKFDNAYRIIKTAGSSGLAKIVTSRGKIPKQDVAADISSRGTLFFYITDFNRESRDPRFRVIFADSNIYKNPCDFWQDIKTSGAIANEGGVKLENGKKPEKLLHRILKMVTKEGDIVLDYHLGSGTTAAVAHKMNRQYIGIEQLDYGENDSVKRLQNVIAGDPTGISDEAGWKGGGEFVFVEIMKWNEQFVSQIEAAKSSKDLLKIWETMKKKAFLSYRVKPEEFDKSVKEFEKLSIDDQKKFLMEVLDKNQLYVNYSEIGDKDFDVSDEDKKLNKKFYGKLA